eukprot:maker-scaffold45_size475391-snap-gene-3.20 protein:Tk10522 transcript:maker-scaffold45_size475391-snap-gene-3.20-mRNA-1 annotation:"neuroglian isoform x1"
MGFYPGSGVLLVLLLGAFRLGQAQVVELPPLISPFPNVDHNWHELLDGMSFSLECQAKGEPQPDIQWFRDLEPFVPVDGVELDGPALRFVEPQVSRDEGRYFCRASNKLGQAQSQVVFVSPALPKSPEWAIAPNFTLKPQVEIKEVDSLVEFKCEAVGSPKPEVIWTKNAEVLPEFADMSTLTINRMSQDDIGTYACNVSNLAGYDYKMVYLNILTQAPIFLESPTNRTVSINQEVFLRCSAKGYPEPEVQWTFNGSPIDLGADDNLEQNERGDLVIKRVQNETAGFYECLAKNVHGQVAAQGYLMVVSKTTIERGPVDMQAQIRSEVTMECSVVWDPSFDLVIQWKKDNADLDLSPGGRITKGEDNSLIIQDLEFADAGRSMEKDANQRSPDSTTTLNPRKRRLIEEWDARSCETPDIVGLPRPMPNSHHPMIRNEPTTLASISEFTPPYPPMARTPSAFSALEPGSRRNITINDLPYPSPPPSCFPQNGSPTVNGFLTPREQTRSLIEIARHTLPGPGLEPLNMGAREISPGVTLELAREGDMPMPVQNGYGYTHRTPPPPPNRQLSRREVELPIVHQRSFHPDMSASQPLAALSRVSLAPRHSPPTPPMGGGTIHHLPKAPSPVRSGPSREIPHNVQLIRASPPMSLGYQRHTPPSPAHTITSGEYHHPRRPHPLDPRESPERMNGLPPTPPHPGPRSMREYTLIPPEGAYPREMAFSSPMIHPQYPPSHMPHQSLMRNGHVRMSPALSEVSPPHAYSGYTDSSCSPSDSGCSSGRTSNPISPQVDSPHNPIPGPSQGFETRRKQPSGSRTSSINSGPSGSKNGERRGGRPSTRSCLNKLIPADCPLNEEQIVDLDMDSFNDLMGKHHFTEEKISYFKDLRRKGKNRQAAKRSRKNKIEQLNGLRVQTQEQEQELRLIAEQKQDFERKSEEAAKRIQLKLEFLEKNSKMAQAQSHGASHPSPQDQGDEDKEKPSKSSSREPRPNNRDPKKFSHTGTFNAPLSRRVKMSYANGTSNGYSTPKGAPIPAHDSPTPNGFTYGANPPPGWSQYVGPEHKAPPPVATQLVVPSDLSDGQVTLTCYNCQQHVTTTTKTGPSMWTWGLCCCLCTFVPLTLHSPKSRSPTASSPAKMAIFRMLVCGLASISQATPIRNSSWSFLLWPPLPLLLVNDLPSFLSFLTLSTRLREHDTMSITSLTAIPAERRSRTRRLLASIFTKTERTEAGNPSCES